MHLCAVGPRIKSSHPPQAMEGLGSLFPFPKTTYEDEGHAALFPGHRGLGLVVPLDLDSDHARLVNNFLDESSVFTNDFTNKASWNLKYELDDGF